MIILDLGLGAGGDVQVVGETPLTEVPGSPLQGALVALSAWAYEQPWVVVAAVTADSYGNEDLWLIDIDAPASPTRLTHTPERERWPSFAPDDSVIVFSSSSLGVGQMNNDGSDVVQLAAKAWRPHRRPY